MFFIVTVALVVVAVLRCLASQPRRWLAGGCGGLGARSRHRLVGPRDLVIVIIEVVVALSMWLKFRLMLVWHG